MDTLQELRSYIETHWDDENPHSLAIPSFDLNGKNLPESNTITMASDTGQDTGDTIVSTGETILEGVIIELICESRDYAMKSRIHLFSLLKKFVARDDNTVAYGEPNSYDVFPNDLGFYHVQIVFSLRSITTY